MPDIRESVIGVATVTLHCNSLRRSEAGAGTLGDTAVVPASKYRAATVRFFGDDLLIVGMPDSHRICDRGWISN